MKELKKDLLEHIEEEVDITKENIEEEIAATEEKVATEVAEEAEAEEAITNKPILLNSKLKEV